ncbi:MAG: methyltransferase domain-containing protein [Chitinivibrionales bacterium]|nr:methyltransferase domain-containing protein [Chitinivibrionales bacterium]MBD3396641.1 methyltransferase domain-containing protein [Chitinivibrionales bacterium]
MVTDITSNYTSPAGREFTLAAGRLSALNPAGRALDLGCGYGDGACSLASEFRCRVTALDTNPENIEFARQLAIEKGVSHLIDFRVEDVLKADIGPDPFDLVLAEGGILSFIGRMRGLNLAHGLVAPSGWLALSDLVVLSETTPSEVLAIFEDHKYHYETEATYRKMLKEAGFTPHLVCMVPQSGWDNYYAHMARRLEDNKGFFADRQIKLAFHKEIDVFYRLEGFRYVGYLVCFARRNA